MCVWGGMGGRLVGWYCVLYVFFVIVFELDLIAVYDLQYNLQCDHSCDGLKAVEKPTVGLKAYCSVRISQYDRNMQTCVGHLCFY